MATLASLRKQAKELGIAATVIRGASSADELEQIIEDHSDGNGSKGKKRGRAAVKKATGKGKAKTTAKKGKTAKRNSKKDEEDEKPKRGRPKGSKNSTTKNSKSASSKSAPAKSTKSKGTAKRRAAADDSGRNMLGEIDYSETDGWNPRDGSVPDVIVKLLKKFRGNRDKVFDSMVDDLWEYVAKKKQDGTKRSKSEAEEMLRYRIAQTDWRFAIQTGQHEASENRVEYGTGGEEKPKAKPKSKPKAETKPKRGRPPKAQEKPKRGRPAGSKSKAKAEAPKRGRGRPKGSKSKK